MTSGGRFDFDDGGTYCGGWEDGKAHGYGVCTGPKGQGEYAGAWHCGFEISGVYKWTTGNNYKGQWTQGKRHGVGVETKGRWIYQGEWTQGFKGRYGCRQSLSTGAKYEGTWTTGLQDGYGVETYADGGTYQGQWLRGIRHGYGVRQSVPYGLAAHCRQKAGRESLTSLRSENEEDHVVKERDRKMDDIRGGFVLTNSRSADTRGRPASTQSGKKRASSVESKVTRTSLRQMIFDGLRIRKQRSAGDMNDVSPARRPGALPEQQFGSLRSSESNASYGSSSQSPVGGASVYTDSNASFVSQDDLTDVNVVESYSGEWKNDKRSGFGVSERSDGLKYEGEWDNNKRHGYGATVFRDGTREEGKYKNNVLASSGRKSRLLILRANKLRDRVKNAIAAAQRASQIALQKSDIAVSRMASARAKSELAVQAASKAQSDSEKARSKVVEYAPDFFQPGVDATKKDVPPLASPSTTDTSKSHATENHTSPATVVPAPDAATSKPIVENHNPVQSSSLTAKSFLSRVAKGVTDIVDLGGGGSSTTEEPRQMTTIGSALISAGIDTSLVRSLNPKAGTLPNAAVNEHDSETLNNPTSNRKNPSSDGGGRLSQVLDPITIEDHFDQYQADNKRASFISRFGSTTSGRNRSRNPGNPFPVETKNAVASDVLPEFSYDNPRVFSAQYRELSSRLFPANNSSPSNSVQSNRSFQRRQTLPVGGFQALMAANPVPPAQNPPTVVRPQPSVGLRKKSSMMASMPDVALKSTIEEPRKYTAAAAMPREEVHLLSLKRREEIRKEREELERRRQEELVLRFVDVKDWCQQRQLLVFVIAINVGLAAMFFNLLAR